MLGTWCGPVGIRIGSLKHLKQKPCYEHLVTRIKSMKM